MIVAPSILSADFRDLGSEIARAERGGAGAVHVDVMDGHFVPNITVGPLVVRAVRRATSLPIDVHLMIESAARFADAFIDAGADWLSVHVEAEAHLHGTLAHIKKRGARVGIAINPATPLCAAEEILSDVDFVLVMSVNPGFGGQAFIPASIDKIRRLRRSILERGLSAFIEVDGGVDANNARELTLAGAEVLVSGSAVFDGIDAEAGVRRIIEAIR